MTCPIKGTFLPIVVMLCLYGTAQGQFAPAAKLPGTTAIPADSSIFVEWAAHCTVERGLMNIANPSLGFASSGDSLNAVGVADAVTVSLGDGGVAIVSFNHPIYNGEGFDFAVFENGFMTNDSNLAFLELGFVEVSTDGNRFVRFPAIANVQDTTQLGNGGSMDCSQLNNLAGKYTARYGTPFDLQELVDSPGIDVNNINYVKVIDVIGSIDSSYGTRDQNGNLINDPWPTPFASCGFDLDALGVINAKGITAIKEMANDKIEVYPNPVQRGSNIRFRLPENTYNIKLTDVNGQMLRQWPGEQVRTGLNTGNLPGGVYFLNVETATEHYNLKLIIE